jgi:hypothetical protein
MNKLFVIKTKAQQIKEKLYNDTYKPGYICAGSEFSAERVAICELCDLIDEIIKTITKEE